MSIRAKWRRNALREQTVTYHSQAYARDESRSYSASSITAQFAQTRRRHLPLRYVCINKDGGSYRVKETEKNKKLCITLKGESSIYVS